LKHRSSSPEDLLTPNDAARLLGVSADTVRNLSDAGKLPTLRTVGGRRLFYRRDVEALRKARNGHDRK
jgi:excisionase family DNA binding protein